MVFSSAFLAQGVDRAQAQTDSVSNNVSNNGTESSGRIVGGSAVPDGKYPFVTALLNKGSGTAYERQFCGGTLIDSDKVLTAAHCVSGKAPSNLRVATGRTVLNSDQGQLRGVSSIEIHPRYDAPAFRYDAAVLTLGRPVANVRPVALANASRDSLESPGSSATIAGWSNTEAQPASGFGGQNYPNRMREARVPMVSDAEASRSYSNYASALMVAAGKIGKDACQGDSGGPMFARSASGYTQIGISSFGIGCAARNYPGVYTEINNLRIKSFIDAQLGNYTSNNQGVNVSQIGS